MVKTLTLDDGSPVANLEPGKTYKLKIVLNNKGSLDVPAINHRLVMSERNAEFNVTVDRTMGIGTDPKSLVADWVETKVPIKAGADLTVEMHVTIEAGLAEGVYYLGYLLQPALPLLGFHETIFALRVVVGAPTPAPDLAAHWVDPPKNLKIGQQFKAKIRVTNVGDAASPGGKLTARIRPDSSQLHQGTPIISLSGGGGYTIPPLDKGKSTTIEADIKITGGTYPGCYWLGPLVQPTKGGATPPEADTANDQMSVFFCLHR